MRKRLLIGAIAVVVIGVGAYFVPQPNTGTIDYHKREYVKSRHFGRWENWFIDYAPNFLREAYYDRKGRKTLRHWKALLALGYYRQRYVFLSSPVTETVAIQLYDLNNLFTNDILQGEGIHSTAMNCVCVLALPENIGKWEQMIREVDAGSATNRTSRTE